MNKILSGVGQVHLLLVLFSRYKQIVHGVRVFILKGCGNNAAQAA